MNFISNLLWWGKKGQMTKKNTCLWSHKLSYLLSNNFLQSNELHSTARSQIEKESKASLHFNNRMQKKSLNEWQGFVSRRQHKKAFQGYHADIVYSFHLRISRSSFTHSAHLAIAHVHLMRLSWRVWRIAWHRKQGRLPQHLKTCILF